MLIGYARVSTIDQNLALQRDALSEAGCEKIFIEQNVGSRYGSAGTHGGAWLYAGRRYPRRMET